MTCAKIVGLIQLTQPAVKINDKALYSFALSEVTSIFFIQIICWMYLYSLDLANLETGQIDLKKVSASIEHENYLLMFLLIWLLSEKSMQMQRVS